MKLNEKQILYKQIMTSVSKIVKKHLNEEFDDKSNNKFMDLFTLSKKTEIIAANEFWYVLSEAIARKTPYIISNEAGRTNLWNKWMKRLSIVLPTNEVKYIRSEYAPNSKVFADNLIEHQKEIHELELEKNSLSKRTNLSGFTTAQDKKRETAAARYVKHTGHGTPIEDITDIELNPGERLLLIRPKYKTSGVEPLLYPFKGKLTRNAADPYKKVYSWEEGISYYAARPILWETVKDDPERQQCTVPGENEDDAYEA